MRAVTSVRRGGAGVVADLVSAAFLLTTLPLPEQRRVSPSGGRQFFPLIGLALGAAAWTAFWGGSRVIGATMGAFLAVTVLVVLTGGLHLDGLGDCADGLFGGWTVERRLEIMRDSRVGSFGAVAIVLVLVGDVVALGTLSTHRALAALVGSAGLARLGMLALVVTLPYARPQGLGTLVEGGRKRLDFLVGAVTAAAPIALDWRHGLLAVGLVVLTTIGVGALALRRIGGVTGDIYGGVLELSQLAAFSAYAVRT
jgi:adenosylcobinamide-GDP ribazoletransferase